MFNINFYVIKVFVDWNYIVCVIFDTKIEYVWSNYVCCVEYVKIIFIRIDLGIQVF